MSELKLDPQIYNSFIKEIEIRNIKLNSLNIYDVNEKLSENIQLKLSLKFDNSEFKVEDKFLNIYSKFFIYIIYI